MLRQRRVSRRDRTSSRLGGDPLTYSFFVHYAGRLSRGSGGRTTGWYGKLELMKQLPVAQSYEQTLPCSESCICELGVVRSGCRRNRGSRSRHDGPAGSWSWWKTLLHMMIITEWKPWQIFTRIAQRPSYCWTTLVERGLSGGELRQRRDGREIESQTRKQDFAPVILNDADPGPALAVSGTPVGFRLSDPRIDKKFFAPPKFNHQGKSPKSR